MTLPLLQEQTPMGKLVEGLTLGTQQALPAIADLLAKRQQQAQINQILGIGAPAKASSNKPDLALPGAESSNLQAQQPGGAQSAQQGLELTPEKVMALSMVNPQMGMMAATLLQAQQKKDISERSYEQERALPFLKEADAARSTLPERKMAIQSLKSVAGDVGYFSKSNLSEVINKITGGKLNLPPDASGAQLMAAGKNLLISSLSKIGGNRPNQYIEQQMYAAQPGIGRSEAANMASILPIEAGLEIEEHYLNTLGKLEKSYKEKLGYVPGEANRQAQELSRDFAEKKMRELAYDLRVNQEKDMQESKLSRLKKVIPGTPLTKKMAQILVNKYKGDAKKAEKAAIQLGFDVIAPERDPGSL